jgi:hypothetical protein
MFDMVLIHVVKRGTDYLKPKDPKIPWCPSVDKR